jgi:hypothetical protein
MQLAAAALPSTNSLARISSSAKLARMVTRGHWGQLLPLCLCLILPLPLKGASSSPAKTEYDKLKQEYKDAQENYSKARQKAKTEAERSKLKYPSGEEYARRFLEIAKKYPQDAAALDSLAWILENSRSGEGLDRALELLLTNYANDEKVGNVLSRLGYSRSDEIEPFLRGMAEKSSLRENRGKALFTLARIIKRRAANTEDIQRSDPESTKDMKNWLGEKTFAALQASDPASFRKEAEQLFETVIAKYADVKGSDRTLGESAKSDLFELRNLAIGLVAQDIEGEDLDGKKFKLSEYRGKVVVLDFWGHW